MVETHFVENIIVVQPLEHTLQQNQIISFSNAEHTPLTMETSPPEEVSIL